LHQNNPGKLQLEVIEKKADETITGSLALDFGAFV
jgi:hypothetical protein